MDSSQKSATPFFPHLIDGITIVDENFADAEDYSQRLVGRLYHLAYTLQ